MSTRRKLRTRKVERTPTRFPELDETSIEAALSKSRREVTFTPKKRQRILKWAQDKEHTPIIQVEADVAESARSDIPGGLDNSGNTCYMNSLVYGMFILSTNYDVLLDKRILGAAKAWLHNSTRESEQALSELQAYLKEIVWKCRNGDDVAASQVEELRKRLRVVGWEGSATGSGIAAMGRTRSGVSVAPNTLIGRMALQQDAAELLMYILDVFNAPTLTLRQRIYHGGVDDTNDEKLLHTRTLEIAVTVDGHEEDGTISFESLLNHHFNDVVTGVRRKRPSGRTMNWDAASISVMEKVLGPSHSEVDSVKSLPPPTLPRGSKMISVKAFRSTLICRTPQESVVPLTIPMVLKRYTSIFGRKTKTRIVIQEEIDFTKFVCPSVEGPIGDPGASRDVRYTLRLRSAICHRGMSVHEGHYYAYTRRDDGTWFRVDDLAMPRVAVCRIDTEPHSEALASESYILFFDLRRWYINVDSLSFNRAPAR